jgi:predicted transcriptional regulator
MRRRRIRQIDSETGEVLEGYVAYLLPKRQNGFHRRWFAMAQDNALDMLMQSTRLDDTRVLAALLKELDYENLILTSQADIARKLGMQPSNVSSAIKRLVQSGVILKGPKRGTNYSYKLNPEFGWKGSAKNHVKALDEHRNERMKAAKITGVVEGGEPDQDPK